MSMSTTGSLEEIALFLGDFRGIDNILELSENSRYEFTPPSDLDASWLGARHDEHPDGPVLCLRFGHHIYSPEGWVCGSAMDVDRADVQIAADNLGGVSRRHFLVDIDPLSLKPRLTVLGQLLRVITRGSGPIVRLRGQSVEVVEPLVVDLGKVSFQVWQPSLVTATQTRIYDRRARQFGHDAVAAMPRYFPSLDSSAPTVSSAMRVGRNGSVYLYKRDVGKGMSATVMLVECQNTRQNGLFVAKEPFYKIADNSGKIQHKWEEVKHEFEQLARLHHPHVVEVFDVASSKDKNEPPWLIMEYIPETLMTKELSETSAIVVATQILSALAHIHANDIVHGDVKPDNILVRHNGTLTAKLADFGLAQHYVKQNLHTLVGTPFYWAPELRGSDIQYSNMADMFSFGLVLLQCVSTFDPSSNPQARHTLDPNKHCAWMRECIVPLVQEQVPQHLRPLLRGLLRREPKKRWSALRCLTWLSPAKDQAWNSAASGIPFLPHDALRNQRKEESKESQVVETGPAGAENKNPKAADMLGQASGTQKRPASSSFESGALFKKTYSFMSEASRGAPETARDSTVIGSQTPVASPAGPTSPSEAPTPGPEETFNVSVGQETADGEELEFDKDWE